jgi:hypothetical protein
VLPLHTTVSPSGDAAAPTGSRGPIRALLLTSLLLAAVAAVVGGAPSLLWFALAVSALGVAAVLGLGSPAAGTALQQTPPAETLPADADDVAIRLRDLHRDYVEQVNLVLAEDRQDLVAELSDAYMDQALALITADARAAH